MGSENREFTRGRLAKHSGVNAETIRYYEQQGLLPNPPRTQGGHRLYGNEHLRRLTFIRRSRELGFSLEQIRGLLDLVDGGDYTCGQIHERTAEHLGEVLDRIADLRKMESVLRKMLSECENRNVPDCPIVDALFG
jgi:MerR family mercuric resistance operon transcriptional regulator